MAISKETIGRLYASGRNYINLGIGFASGIGIISAAQSKGLMDSLGEIYTGVSQIIHGATSAWQIIAVMVAPIVGPILARMASNSAKTVNQAAAVQTAIKDPNTPVDIETKASLLDATMHIPEVKTPTIKVSDPILAQLTPNTNVVVSK